MNPERRVVYVIYGIVIALLLASIVLLLKRYWSVASVLLTTAGAIVDLML